MSSLLPAVHLGRIEYPLALRFEPVGGHSAEETALVPLVAGVAADLFDFEQDRVAIAVDIDRADKLDVAALLALAPELLPAAAVIDGLAGPQRFGVAFRVHVGHHQHLAARRVLGDRRQ